MEREDIAKNLGNNIKRFRLEKGFSQENLALRAGIHPAYLGRLERGEKCPTLDTVFKICDALSVPVADIITFSEKENKSEGDKKTVEEILEKLPKSKQDKLLDIIKQLNEDISVNAILVQMPLPNHINSNLIIETISPFLSIE